MFFRILKHYLIGYVNIQVEGYFIERFINICIAKDIFLWNIRREKSSLMYANISKKDFKQLKTIVKKTKSRLKIRQKKGLPFLMNKYRKRKLFGALLITILAIIFILSRFIWNIEIVGNEKIKTDELIKCVEENGIKIGDWKRNIDTKQVVNNIRLKRDDIAWIGIELKGTNAIIQIVEADKKPEIINEEEYCNIVSNKAGVITKINAQNGTALVKIGDVVQNGTILVGGWLEGKFTGTRYVHSEAQIEARVWYSKKEKMNLTQEEYIQTNNTEKRYSLKFNNFVINLYKKLPNFKNYDTISKNKKVKLFSDLYLPIEIVEMTFQEKTKSLRKYTTDEAKQTLIQKLEEELKKEIEQEENIINKQINVNEQENSVEVEVIYEVIETIGTKEKIIF